MSNFSITVYDLMKNNFDFGLDDYEIFDNGYRELLNNAILEHYKFKEIAFQNPMMWRDRLRNRMNVIMRNKYNILYEKKMIEFNPLYNVEMIETYEGTTNIKNTNKATTTSINDVTTNSDNDKTINIDNLGVGSQFPSEEMTENDLTSNLFVDNANKQKGTTTDKTKYSDTINTVLDDVVDNNGTTDGGQNYVKRTEGSSAGLPFSKAMLQFKDYVEKFQLDRLVIEELSDLFYHVWNI